MARTLTLLKIHILLFSSVCYEGLIQIVKVHSLYKLLEFKVSVGGFMFCFFHGRGKYIGYKMLKFIRCRLLVCAVECFVEIPYKIRQTLSGNSVIKFHGRKQKVPTYYYFCSEGKIRWSSLVWGRTTAVLVLGQHTFLLYSTILKWDLFNRTYFN